MTLDYQDTPCKSQAPNFVLVMHEESKSQFALIHLKILFIIYIWRKWHFICKNLEKKIFCLFRPSLNKFSQFFIILHHLNIWQKMAQLGKMRTNLWQGANIFIILTGLAPVWETPSLMSSNIWVISFIWVSLRTLCSHNIWCAGWK